MKPRRNHNTRHAGNSNSRTMAPPQSHATKRRDSLSSLDSPRRLLSRISESARQMVAMSSMSPPIIVSLWMRCHPSHSTPGVYHPIPYGGERYFPETTGLTYLPGSKCVHCRIEGVRMTRGQVERDLRQLTHRGIARGDARHRGCVFAGSPGIDRWAGPNSRPT